MRISGSIGNTAHRSGLHIHGDRQNSQHSKIEGKRQVAILALAGGFAASVLAGRIVRNPRVRGVSRGCAMQRTILVMGTFLRAQRRVHALRHRIGNVHLEPEGEM